MGKNIELTATDGHKFSAYVAEPSGKPKGALIVVMEIFGVNSHVKRVTDEYAADGYLAIAPAFFDRVERGLDVGYTPPDIERARGLMQKMNFNDPLKDVEAAKTPRGVGGQDRHHRLLLGWRAIVQGGVQRGRARVRGRLLRRRHPCDDQREAQVPGASSTGARPTHRFRSRKRRKSRKKHMDEIHYFYPGRATASTASSAARTTRRPRSSRAPGRWNSCGSISGRAYPAPSGAAPASGAGRPLLESQHLPLPGSTPRVTHTRLFPPGLKLLFTTAMSPAPFTPSLRMSNPCWLPLKLPFGSAPSGTSAGALKAGAAAARNGEGEPARWLAVVAVDLPENVHPVPAIHGKRGKGRARAALRIGFGDLARRLERARRHHAISCIGCGSDRTVHRCFPRERDVLFRGCRPRSSARPSTRASAQRCAGH